MCLEYLNNITEYLKPFGGIIIGAILAYFLTKRNIISQRVFDSRQEWIDSVGDLVSAFFALSIRIYFDQTKKPLPPHVDDVGNRQELIRLYQRIVLKLNPHDNSHAEIEKILDQMIASINKSSIDGNTSTLLGESLVQKTQLMLKNEWEKIKKGK